jgi:hypothetical protein
MITKKNLLFRSFWKKKVQHSPKEMLKENCVEKTKGGEDKRRFYGHYYKNKKKRILVLEDL